METGREEGEEVRLCYVWVGKSKISTEEYPRAPVGEDLTSVESVALRLLIRAPGRS